MTSVTFIPLTAWLSGEHIDTYRVICGLFCYIDSPQHSMQLQQSHWTVSLNLGLCIICVCTYMYVASLSVLPGRGYCSQTILTLVWNLCFS